MESSSTTNNTGGGIKTSVGLQFHTRISYDRRTLKKSLRAGAAVVRKEARRLVSRRAISAPGDFPGMVTGALKRSIGVVSQGRGGGWIKVGPRSIPGKVFYPAFLYYGVASHGLQARKNFMEAALDAKRSDVQNKIKEAIPTLLVAS